ncbi:MAG: hypothetical protein GX485_07225 [Clostridiales bacterium]|jgi:hypothetical protein|nr:hypothetical protein [Clostridiales bacterium]
MQRKKTDENASLLNHIYHTAQLRLDAVQMLLPQVRNEPPLRRQAERQKEDYLFIAEKTKQMLRDSGRMPDSERFLKKAVSLGSLRMNTFANKTPAHIAKVMITGTEAGISDMTKNLNLFDGAEIPTKKLAEEYILNEQKNIDALRLHTWHA